MQPIDTLELVNFFQIKKKERQENWQEKGDTAINELAAEYNKLRTSSEIKTNQLLQNLLLTYFAIIDLAADAGNREAKRRNLDTSVWSDLAPATVWSIAETPVLRTLILKTIGKKFTKRPWYSNYMANCLGEASDLSDASLVVEIILSSLGDKEATWSIILEPANRPSSLNQIQWFESLLFRINKKVKVNPQYLSNSFAHQIKHEIIDQLDLASSSTIKSSMAEVILTAMTGRAVACLSAPHLSLIWSCKPENPLDRQPKPTYKKLFEKLTQTIVDVSLLPCDDGTKTYLVDVWTISAQAFYASEKAALASISAGDRRVLTELLDRKGRVENVDSIETLISEISACWSERTPDCFISAPALQNLDGILETARKRYGVTEISPSDTAVAFDPIVHHLVGSDSDIYGDVSVQVIKPGYIKHRENGSSKVIKKALVELSDD